MSDAPDDEEEGYVKISVGDADSKAWEEALSFMFPSGVPLSKVTWENTERLLLLADMYDMPGIKGEWVGYS
jgi:hypothetical protein